MSWYFHFKKHAELIIMKWLTSKPSNNSVKIIKHFVNNSRPRNIHACFLKLQNLRLPFQKNNSSTKKKEHYLKSKIDNLVTWYEQLTGMDEVRFMQNRVIVAQNQLVSAQNTRRESSKALSSVQNRLKEIYAELDTTTRGEERYLQLITLEHAILKEERLLNDQFNQNEKEERDCFTFLSSAVKESHEKERAQAERTKYWSVIGSIIGTVIGVLGSSINNEFKMRELKKLVKDSINNSYTGTTMDAVSLSTLNEQAKELLSVINEIRASNLKNLEPGTNVDVILQPLHHVQEGGNFERNIERLLEQQKYEARIALLVVSAVGITLPVLIAVIQRFT